MPWSRPLVSKTPDQVEICLYDFATGKVVHCGKTKVIENTYAEYLFRSLSEGWYRVSAKSSGPDIFTSTAVHVGHGGQDAVTIRLAVRHPVWHLIFEYGLPILPFLGAVLVTAGLLKGFLARLIFRYPFIELEMEDKTPYFHKINYKYSDFIDDKGREPKPPRRESTNPNVLIYYYRFWVKNSGTVEAKNVEVYLNRVWRWCDRKSSSNDKKWFNFVQPAGAAVKYWQLEEKFHPVNLRWAATWDITENPAKIHKPELLLRHRISPDVGRFCDLGFVLLREFDHLIPFANTPEIDPSVAESDVPAPRLYLAAETLSQNYDRRIDIGTKALLQIVIDGDNTNAVPFYIQCTINEAWDPHEKPPIKLKLIRTRRGRKSPPSEGRAEEPSGSNDPLSKGRFSRRLPPFARLKRFFRGFG